MQTMEIRREPFPCVNDLLLANGSSNGVFVYDSNCDTKREFIIILTQFLLVT